MSPESTGERVRTELARLARTRATGATDDPVALVRERVGRRQSRRRVRRLALASTGLIGLVLIAVAFISTRTPDARDPVRVGTPSSPAAPTPSTVPSLPQSSVPGVERLDPGPLALRTGAAVAWTGRQLVVWGGKFEVPPARSFSDGAVYDEAARSWRMMSEGPLPANMTNPVAATIDEDVVIARGRKVARWVSASDEWRQLPDAPAPVNDLQAMSSTTMISASANAVLDLQSRQWQRLPEPPQTFTSRVVVWTGEVLVVMGTRPGEFPGPVPTLVYSPDSDGWQTAPSPHLVSNAVAADWTGSEVLAIDYENNAAAFDPVSETWRLVPAVPAGKGEWSPSLRSVSTGSVAFMPLTLAVLGVDGRTDWWTPLPYGDVLSSGSMVTTSTAVFVFGLSNGGFPDAATALVRIDPAVLVREARQLQIGATILTIPDGTTVLHVDHQDFTGRAEISTESGRCEVRSTARGENESEQGFEPDASGRRWTGSVGADQVEVECDDPDTARVLALDHVAPPPAYPGQG